MHIKIRARLCTPEFSRADQTFGLRFQGWN